MFFDVNPIDIHIGQKLKEVRIAAGMNQAQAGELIGVSYQQFQKYEMGINRIAASRLYEFSQLFDKPLSSFFEDYVPDEEYHNYQFKSEEEREEIDEAKNKELNNLIKAYNRVSKIEAKERIIDLLNSLADKRRY